MAKPTGPAIPAELKPFLSETGVHRRGIKAAWFGKWKAGKSTCLSYYPGPKVVLDCGHGGIQHLLEPEDKVFECATLDVYGAGLDFAFANQDYYKSVVIDDFSELWTGWMEEWQEKNLKANEDMGAKHWRHVKGPWKRRLRQLNRSKLHVGISARLKDIDYFVPEAAPGESESGLKVRKVVTPETEKNVPYVVDLIFHTEAVFDYEGRPTPEHKITFWAGRVPRKLTSELYIGKSWAFDARQPESVWDKIIVPIYDKWTDGAVEHLGIDPEKAREALQDISLEGKDADEGLVRRVLRKEFKTLAQYQTEWTKLGLTQIVSALPTNVKNEIMEIHRKKRMALEAK